MIDEVYFAIGLYRNLFVVHEHQGRAFGFGRDERKIEERFGCSLGIVLPLVIQLYNSRTLLPSLAHSS